MVVSNPAGPLGVSVHGAAEWKTLRHTWDDLVANCPSATFFLTGEWVDAWLDTFAPQLRPQILIFCESGTPVGACLLVRRKHYYGFVPVDRVYLNTAGEDPCDSPYIEFNDLLCVQGREQEVASALVAHISQRQPDEVSLDGFCTGPALTALRNALSGMQHASEVRLNYYVDLQALRTTNMTYEASLGQKTRYRLRQNYKMYGDIVVKTAATPEQANAMFDALAELNHQLWKKRGTRTAFQSEHFVGFHRTLIERAFSMGCIQMLHFSANDKEIGYMYNFIYRGKVYFYQSGLAYSENKRVRPGFVCIGKSINYCLERQHLTEFHLMPGGDHYKESMATNSQPIEWLIARNTNTKNRAVDLLRTIKRRIKPVPAAATTTVASADD